MMPGPQLPRRCPQCLARLGPGHDIPGCLQCGWEDYHQMETVAYESAAALPKDRAASMREGWAEDAARIHAHSEDALLD